MDDSQLPTASDLAKLPRRAIVAFAASCARTVLPLFKEFWPDAPARHVDALIKAVRVAESFGAGERIVEFGSADARDAARAVRDAHDAARDANAYPARDAARAVAYAARAVVDAAAAAYDSSAVLVAADAADAAAAAARITTHQRIVADWIKIRDAAVGWTEDASVPPSFFLPIVELSPANVMLSPAKVMLIDFGTMHRRGLSLEIVLEFPNDASDDEIDRATASVVSTADALHRAQGGHGLVLDSLQAEQPAAAEVTP